MSGKALFTIVLTISCAVFGFAQQNEIPKEKIEKPCTETQILADRKQEIDFSGKTFGRRDSLKFLLPAQADGWVVEIVTTGGFSGKGLPTLTVTSNGNFWVTADNILAENQLSSTGNGKLKTEVLQKVSQIITAQTLTEKTKNVVGTGGSAEKEISFVCNDCYQTTITIVRRDADGRISYFSNREKSVLFSSGDFNRIYQIIREQADFLN
ncbi:MAG: hypothetical protein M3209_08435 [Acidobacteriota bacterium]|nr:hypothetical protein [Acidobacteriota bacterium]